MKTFKNPDETWSLSALAFAGAWASSVFKFLFSGVIITFGDNTFNFGSTDGSAIGAFLGAAGAVYVARRHSMGKNDKDPKCQMDE